MTLPIYIGALSALAGGLAARPAYLNSAPGNACMQCHGGAPVVPGGTTQFLKINGAAASAPFGVTIAAGANFTFEYRVTGQQTGSGLPLIGGYIRPVGGTLGWGVSNGPLWTDNSQSAATPWGAYFNDVAFGTTFGAPGNPPGGATPDDGTGPDLNQLNSNEVFSATVQAPAAAGSYELYAGAAGVNNIGKPEISEDRLYVIVINATPTPTSTISATPNLSETPTHTPTISATFTISPTQTPMPSFPSFGQAAFVPNPSSGATSLMLETYSASQIELRIYSASFGRSYTLDLGHYAGGKGSLALKLPADMANGAYFAQVLSTLGGRSHRSAIIPLVILR